MGLYRKIDNFFYLNDAERRSAEQAQNAHPRRDEADVYFPGLDEALEKANQMAQSPLLSRAFAGYVELPEIRED